MREREICREEYSDDVRIYDRCGRGRISTKGARILVSYGWRLGRMEWGRKEG